MDIDSYRLGITNTSQASKASNFSSSLRYPT